MILDLFSCFRSPRPFTLTESFCNFVCHTYKGNVVSYSSSAYLRYKPAAAVAVCRRGGASATFDRLNKYFTITDMPVVPSQYWNSVHGRLPGEAAQDAEGLQTMRTLGRNMAWMLKNRAAGNIPEPEKEEPVRTNFIR